MVKDVSFIGIIEQVERMMNQEGGLSDKDRRKIVLLLRNHQIQHVIRSEDVFGIIQSLINYLTSYQKLIARAIKSAENKDYGELRNSINGAGDYILRFQGKVEDMQKEGLLRPSE